MQILIIEPYFTGSHKAWAEGYQKYSVHKVKILSLGGQFWKWRMHGSAVTLAQQFLSQELNLNLILATDMLDVATFLALTRNKTASIPVAIYFHENQLCYPWSPEDQDVFQQRDQHYGFINYTSALAADAVFFNSDYQKKCFLNELPNFLKQFPDHRGIENVARIAAKSQVLHLGLDLHRFDQRKPEGQAKNKSSKPIILWNHRWEYDKNPQDFFRALSILQQQGLDFHVAILGENFSQQPIEFQNARVELGDKIVHFGYVKDFAHYAEWLFKADIIPVTSNQDFFGAAAVSAIYCGCYPILPNRLAFPEIFPIELYPENFYHQFEEFVEKLAWAIKNIAFTRQKKFSSVVEKYSWHHMASQYDSIFENVMRTLAIPLQ